MPRKNYFELTGLDFDPPESNARKIDRAIEAWKKNLEDILGNEQNDSRRKELQAELSLYEDMKTTLSAPKTRNPEAKACKEEKLTQLDTLIQIMTEGESGTREITNGYIRGVATKLRLQPATVKDVYVKKGFTVQANAANTLLNDQFMKTNEMTDLSRKLGVLRGIKEAKYPWFSKVSNLYDLTNYYCGGDDSSRKDYRRKKTTDLLAIMEKGAAQYASYMSDPGHALSDLFQFARAHVFADEDSRRKHDHSMERDSLSDFFASRIIPRFFRFSLTSISDLPSPFSWLDFTA